MLVTVVSKLSSEFLHFQNCLMKFRTLFTDEEKKTVILTIDDILTIIMH